MVENRKLEYVNIKRNDKPLVALEIVLKLRALSWTVLQTEQNNRKFVRRGGPEGKI